MSTEAVETVARTLDEYGAAMRGDWSDVDGRSVQSVLDDLAEQLRGVCPPRTIDQNRYKYSLCPDGLGHWEWHCYSYDCPTYVTEQADRE